MSRFEKEDLVIEREPNMSVSVRVGGTCVASLSSLEWSEVVNRVALRPFGGRSVDCAPHDGTGYIDEPLGASEA